MLDNPYERKLTVIVSADVADYARLTELNELETHTHLRKRLDLLREYVEYHHGSVLRTHGDGCLCSFDSVINAFKATLELQQTSNLLNSSLPQASQIHFRVGIHLSEVIIDNSEPYGNGVNVAVRLQQLAIPGEIIVSKETAQFISQNNAFAFSKSKRLKLKNINRKMYACKLLGHSISRSQPKRNYANNGLLFATATLAAVMLLFTIFTYNQSTHSRDYRDISVGMSDSESHVVETSVNSSQNNSGSELLKVKSEVETVLADQLSVIAEKVDNLNGEIVRLQSKLNDNSDEFESGLKSVNLILSQQEEVMGTLSSSVDQSHYVAVNASYDEDSYYEYEDSPSFSENYITKSIDLLDEIESSTEKKAASASKDTFGCLSCSSNYSTQNNRYEETGQLRDTAVVFGDLSGKGAHRYISSKDTLKNFMSLKLQESIKQSSFGANINKFTYLDSDMGHDAESFEKLCEDDNTLLVASFELIINGWYADGTYLHFYNCNNHKSTSHLEKKLAPTIHNVKDPYLSDEVLVEVNRSVDYIVDKLQPAGEQI